MNAPNKPRRPQFQFSLLGLMVVTFVVAAGNVARHRWEKEHLDRSDVEPVHDPAQAWNALGVGAYTTLTDPGGDHRGYQPVAPAGELSPHSCTSVAFASQWPPKPDILLEGGNLAISETDDIDTPVSMQLLTTHGRDNSRLLTVSNATSAATAQAARMAAKMWVPASSTPGSRQSRSSKDTSWSHSSSLRAPKGSGSWDAVRKFAAAPATRKSDPL